MKSKKIRWEKPKLLDLNDENTIAHGACGFGSSAGYTGCNSGGSASNCGNGGTVTYWCGSGGNHT